MEYVWEIVLTVLCLMGLGLLQATPRGRAALERVCRFKRSLFGKGAA